MIMKRISYFVSLKAIMLFAFLYIGEIGLSHAQEANDELKQVKEADSKGSYLHIEANKDTSGKVVFDVNQESDDGTKLLKPDSIDKKYYIFTNRNKYKYAKITLANDSVKLTYDGHFDFQKYKNDTTITEGTENSNQLKKGLRVEGWINLEEKDTLLTFTNDEDSSKDTFFLVPPIDNFRDNLSVKVGNTKITIGRDTIKTHKGDSIKLEVQRNERGQLKRIAWDDTNMLPICDGIETELSAKRTSAQWDTTVAVPNDTNVESLLIQYAYFDKGKGKWQDSVEISIPVVVLPAPSNSSYSILWLVLIVIILFVAYVFIKNKIAKKRAQTLATEGNKMQYSSQDPNNSAENGTGTQNEDEDKQEAEETHSESHKQKQPSWQKQFINAWNKEYISPRLKEEDAPRLIQIFAKGYLNEEKRAEWDAMQQWKSQIIKNYKLKENASFEDVVSTYKNDIYQKGYNDNNKSCENKESDANALKYKEEWKAMLEELNKEYHVSIDLNILETNIEDLHSLIIEKIKEITTQADDMKKNTVLTQKEKHQNDVEKLLQEKEKEQEKEIKQLKKEHKNELQEKDREKETALNELKEKHQNDVEKLLQEKEKEQEKEIKQLKEEHNCWEKT